MYNDTKAGQGVQERDVIKPEMMSHFHIEAFGDQIECNRYVN